MDLKELPHLDVRAVHDPNLIIFVNIEIRGSVKLAEPEGHGENGKRDNEEQYTIFLGTWRRPSLKQRRVLGDGLDLSGIIVVVVNCFLIRILDLRKIIERVITSRYAEAFRIHYFR